MVKIGDFVQAATLYPARKQVRGMYLGPTDDVERKYDVFVVLTVLGHYPKCKGGIKIIPFEDKTEEERVFVERFCKAFGF